MLFIDKQSMNTSTFEEACLIAFSKKAEVIKTVAFTGMGFGTVEVNSPVELACGAWDWKEEVNGFKFFRA
jgi:hypothetical protein